VWWCWLCFLPRGEDTFKLTIFGGRNVNSSIVPTMTLYTDASDLSEPSYSDEMSASENIFTGNVKTQGETGLALLVVKDFIGLMSSVSFGPQRIAREMPRATRDSAARVNVVAPGADPIGFAQMDDGLFVDSYAINAWMVSRLDANLNALEEFGGGWPAAGNAAFTQTENSAFNPSVSRFSSGQRAGFASEPIPQIPLVSACFGGIKVGGGFLVDPSADPPTVGALEGYAPYALTGGGLRELARVRCCTPAIPVAAGALKWAVLLGSSTPRTFADCTVEVQMGTSAAASGTATAVASLPTASGWLGLLSGTGLAYGASDTAQDFQVRINPSSSSFARTDFCLLSAVAYFDP